MSPSDVAGRLEAAFDVPLVQVSGADCSFEVVVTSDAFLNVRLLERQRLVLALFEEELSDGRLHALSVTAKTYAEAAADRARPTVPALVSLEGV